MRSDLLSYGGTWSLAVWEEGTGQADPHVRVGGEGDACTGGASSIIHCTTLFTQLGILTTNNLQHLDKVTMNKALVY